MRKGGFFKGKVPKKNTPREKIFLLIALRVEISLDSFVESNTRSLLT